MFLLSHRTMAVSPVKDATKAKTIGYGCLHPVVCAGCSEGSVFGLCDTPYARGPALSCSP
jgi:hypothetical protein